MKKLLSVFLAMLMLCATFAPALSASAADADDTPIVLIRGDGNTLVKVDENGKEISIPSNNDNIKDKVAETAFNILVPFLVEGLLQDKWDNYCQVVYEEFAPLYEEIRLDGDGNPRYNSSISASDVRANERAKKSDPLRWKNQYNFGDYTYWYDWRLDPYDVVDDFFDYIKNISITTGRKVTLVGYCLGGSYVYAFLEKYCQGENTEGLKYVDRVFFNATIGNGNALLTDIFCGDIEIDGRALQRYIDETTDANVPGFGSGFIKLATSPEVNDVILTTVDLLIQLGALDKLGASIDEIYAKVYETLVPMLAIAFYANMPSYWTAITPDRFEEAKEFVFGTEEYKQEYAGMIEKIDNYYEKVSSRHEEIIRNCQANGLYFGALAKYEKQLVPFIKSQNKFADEQTSFFEASFGATSAKTVNSVLSDKYIQTSIENGTGKYISLDKKVDASTSIFKDSLWIEKNISHFNLKKDAKIIEAFSRTPNFTVWDDPNLPQYFIGIPGTEKYDPETGERDPYDVDIEIMNEENCNFSSWNDTPDYTKEEKPNLVTKLLSFFNWLIAMFKMLFSFANEKTAEPEQP
ncbi:MAG: hypothetical protein ACI4GC_05830 [Acutalibacteraceae bacterium]